MVPESPRHPFSEGRRISSREGTIAMFEPRMVLAGLVFGESSRWYGDRAWFVDLGAGWP